MGIKVWGLSDATLRFHICSLWCPWPVHPQRLSNSSCLWFICAADRDVAFEGGQRLQSVTGSEAASGTWPFDADGASSPVAHVLTPVHTGAAL